MLNRKIFRVQGFTLAEVLITLGIIGIVVAMTIPTLINNIADAQYKVALKKAFSSLSQAQKMLTTDNGGQFVDAISSCVAADNTCLKNVIKTRLAYIKECDYGASLGICFPSLASAKQLNGIPATGQFYDSGASGLILKDGASINMVMDSPTCTTNYGGIDRCGWITVDVNGLKLPNTWGKDIYLFILQKDKIVPSAANVPDGSITTDDCVGGGLGFTCASKYL